MTETLSTQEPKPKKKGRVTNPKGWTRDRPTPKQEKFARAYARSANAADAYRTAYCAEGMAPQTIRRQAHELTKKPYVIEIVQEEKKRINELIDREIVIDRSTITAMLLEDRKLAHDCKQSGAAVQATQVLGKVHGLIIERSANLNLVKDLSKLPDEALMRVIAEAREMIPLPAPTEGGGSDEQA